MKLKGLTAIMLTVCILAFSLVPIASAASFPDVTSTHSWAADAINDMAERGILKGFPDGTFQPDAAITKMDSLIIASRILGYVDPDNEKYIDAANDAYEKDLAAYNIDYKGEVAYLLYRDVLKTSELASYISDANKGKAMRRHEAAVLLAKLVGGESTVQGYGNVNLTYDDSNAIPSASKPYVYFVNDVGLMNGMENNLFNPLNDVTRAMMATMMYRADQYMKVASEVVTVTSTTPSQNKFSAVNAEDDEVEFEVPDTAVIKVDGKNANIASLLSDLQVKITYYNRKIVFIEAIASDMQFNTSGLVKGTSTSQGTKMISIYSPTGSSDDAKTYSLASNCTFTLNGEYSTFNAMKSGLYVTLSISGGVVTKIAAENQSKTYNGTITEIDLAENAIITIRTNGGGTAEYGFSDSATLKRNGKTAEVRELSVGDSIQFTVSKGVITNLTATSQSKTVKGTIEAINISSAPSITIKDAGESTEYAITTETKFLIDGEEATIYELRLTASATLNLDGNNVTRISTTKLQISNVLVGTVNYVHPTSNVMGIDVVNSDTGLTETIQCVVKSSVQITDVTSTRVSQFKNLTAGRSVVVTGTVNYGVFEVATITITN